MAEHARLKNEFTEDEKYHKLMRWLIIIYVSEYSHMVSFVWCNSVVLGGGGTICPGSRPTLLNVLIAGLLWTAPELLRMHHRPPSGTLKGDVYSFGIICQEIVYRNGVFFLANLDLDPHGKTIRHNNSAF